MDDAKVLELGLKLAREVFHSRDRNMSETLAVLAAAYTSLHSNMELLKACIDDCSELWDRVEAGYNQRRILN